MIVAEARRQGLMVILDLHSITDDSFTHDTWYGIGGYTEDDWVNAWRTMASRFGDDPNVVAADLKNEPHGAATWGTGAATDWRRAAERAGDAVHEIAPHWLVIVEGIEGPVAGGQHLDRHWWGGNLEGVHANPVRLQHDHKLVYSPHEYGPSVFAQPWFSDPDMQAILYDRWQKGFDYIADAGAAPILIGEFGAKEAGTDTAEGIWLRQFADFLGRRGHSWTFWSWNPNSGDTGGVLADDWRTPVAGKLALLQQLQRREPIDFPRTTQVPDDTDVGGGPAGSGGGTGGPGPGSGGGTGSGGGSGSGGSGGGADGGGSGGGEDDDTGVSGPVDAHHRRPPGPKLEAARALRVPRRPRRRLRVPPRRRRLARLRVARARARHPWLAPVPRARVLRGRRRPDAREPRVQGHPPLVGWVGGNPRSGRLRSSRIRGSSL